MIDLLDGHLFAALVQRHPLLHEKRPQLAQVAAVVPDRMRRRILFEDQGALKLADLLAHPRSQLRTSLRRRRVIRCPVTHRDVMLSMRSIRQQGIRARMA